MDKTSSNPLLMSSKEKKNGKSNKSSKSVISVEENGYNTWSDGRATLRPTTNGFTRRTWPLTTSSRSTSGRTDPTKRSAHLGLVVIGLGQSRWTSTVPTSHLPGKPLRNPRTWTSWQLGLGPRKHIGRNPWIKRSTRELTGLSYWLGQQSPSGRNTEGSRGSYDEGYLIWYTDLGASRASLRLTLRTSRQRILANWTP